MHVYYTVPDPQSLAGRARFGLRRAVRQMLCCILAAWAFCMYDFVVDRQRGATLPIFVAALVIAVPLGLALWLVWRFVYRVLRFAIF
jgi:hypothetical protein